MDQRVEKNLKQMRGFILQEAKEKQEEIESKAQEDYYVEKNNLFEAEKEKIKKEFERKQSQISVKRRIEASNRTNAILLDVQKRRNELLQETLEKAMRRAAQDSKNKTQYKILITDLIAQGLAELLEPNVLVLAREEDLDVVRPAIKDAVAKAKKLIAPKVIDFTVAVDENERLPAGPDPSREGHSCCGGIILTCHGGKIRLNNTLEARLKIAYENLQPQMKKIYFPDKLQNEF
ncbi:MAG: V-type H+-transporting ATPase subunit E [Streblomastix strix]|uniref:V-type H+-transporting ATPase subunit E n=1 Tax=Streblomastix strix TaxID=222440 RepID=A0A5J4V0Q0_9EUKA|nr:MAG: V-type H+-transporting ATPase subunit E [Streblomastix strix]